MEFDKNQTSSQSKGEHILSRCLQYTQAKQSPILLVNESFWSLDDVSSFIEALKKNRFKDFLMTESSSGLMQDIHWLHECRCSLSSPVQTKDGTLALYYVIQ